MGVSKKTDEIAIEIERKHDCSIGLEVKLVEGLIFGLLDKREAGSETNRNKTKLDKSLQRDG